MNADDIKRLREMFGLLLEPELVLHILLDLADECEAWRAFDDAVPYRVITPDGNGTRLHDEARRLRSRNETTLSCYQPPPDDLDT